MEGRVRLACVVESVSLEMLLRKVLTDSPDQVQVEICRFKQKGRCIAK